MPCMLDDEKSDYQRSRKHADKHAEPPAGAWRVTGHNRNMPMIIPPGHSIVATRLHVRALRCFIERIEGSFAIRCYSGFAQVRLVHQIDS
jgi:hypothetical protein